MQKFEITTAEKRKLTSMLKRYSAKYNTMPNDNPHPIGSVNALAFDSYSQFVSDMINKISKRYSGEIPAFLPEFKAN